VEAESESEEEKEVMETFPDLILDLFFPKYHREAKIKIKLTKMRNPDIPEK
jgi:hypothetical protein